MKSLNLNHTGSSKKQRSLLFLDLSLHLSEFFQTSIGDQVSSVDEGKIILWEVY